MNVQRLTFLCSASLLIAACGGEAPAELDIGSETAGLHGHRSVARGRGFQELSSGQREFKFRAVKRPNGKVRGSYTIRLTGPDLFFTVDVTCLAVEGNIAWVAGIISDTNADIIEVGTVSYFYAIDNGKGKKAEPDVISTARINDVEGEDLAFCNDRPLLLDAAPIDGGRIRIR